METNESNKIKQIKIPGIKTSYSLSTRTFHPYTQAEMMKALQKLSGKCLYIDFQIEIEGTQTAARLIRETLSKFGVSWSSKSSNSEAVIWIQGGTAEMRFAFVVTHPNDRKRFIAAECGPRELTATIMSALCEYFFTTNNYTAKDELSTVLAKVNELNRAITGVSLAQDWGKARELMKELSDVIRKLGKIGGSEAVKPIVDALGDSALTYEATGFVEAKALSEAAIAALKDIGPEARLWINKGIQDLRPAIRKVFTLALQVCEGKKWWQFWK